MVSMSIDPVEPIEPLEPTELLETIARPSKLPDMFSKSEYLDRLGSFKPSTYFAKPECLSPIICARFGWTNPTTDVIACANCNSALAIKLHPCLKPADKHQMAQEYRSKLCCAHKPTCPFRSNKFPPTSSPLPGWMASVVPDYLVELMESPTPGVVMEKMAKRLDMISGRKEVAQVELTCSGEEQILVDDVRAKLGIGRNSFLSLALFGWDSIAPIQDSVMMLLCGVCLAEAELDCSQEHTNEARTLEQEPTSKRQKRTMDPIKSHRHYCPWKCGFPCDSTPVQPLWQVIAKRLVSESPPQPELELEDSFRAIQHMLSSAISDKIAGRK